jgi:hypothetical protein
MGRGKRKSTSSIAVPVASLIPTGCFERTWEDLNQDDVFGNPQIVLRRIEGREIVAPLVSDKPSRLSPAPESTLSKEEIARQKKQIKEHAQFAKEEREARATEAAKRQADLDRRKRAMMPVLERECKKLVPQQLKLADMRQAKKDRRRRALLGPHVDDLWLAIKHLSGASARADERRLLTVENSSRLQLGLPLIIKADIESHSWLQAKKERRAQQVLGPNLHKTLQTVKHARSQRGSKEDAFWTQLDETVRAEDPELESWLAGEEERRTQQFSVV